MSYTITDAEIRKFDAEVKGVYQASDILGPLFRAANAGGASTYQFVRRGYGMGTRSVPGSDIPGMGSSTDKTIVTRQDWNNAEYVDFFQNDQVNWDAIRNTAVEVCAPAAGRRKTQIIISALDAAASVTEIDADYSTSGTDSGIIMRKIQRANAILSDRAVPAMDRVFIAPYSALEVMLSTAEFTSMDYVSHQLNSAQEGKITKFGGFNWVFIPNNPEGGLTYTYDGTNNIYDCYAVHKNAIGVIVGSSNVGGSERMMTTVDKVPQKGSWLVNAPLSCGAGVIETNGIIRVKAAITPIT